MTTTTIEAPTPSNVVLKALVAVLELSTSVEIIDSSSCTSMPTMVVKQMDPFATHTTRTRTIEGWTDIIQNLCQHTVLWDNVHSEQIITWLQEGETFVALDKDDSTTMTSQELVKKIDVHLTESDDTYLVGDYVSAADVVLAIWMYQYQQQHDITGIPSQVQAWMTTILAHSIIQQVLTTSSTTTSTTTGTTTVENLDTVPTETTDTETDNGIIRQLREWNLDYTVYDHVQCTTAEELVTNVPIDNPERESHTKNLFFKDKKHGLFLVTLHPSTHMGSTKMLGPLLGLSGKVNLRLADASILKDALNVQPGCVGPLCIINNNNRNDPKQKVTLVLDQALLDLDKIHSHPCDNTKSVVMTPSTLRTYLAKAGATVVVVDFKAAAAAAGSDDTATAPSSSSNKKKQPSGTSTSSVAVVGSKDNKKQTIKGKTLLALQWKKDENFAMWYSDVIVLSEMISYYDISGCYILRPWSYKIWELLQQWFNQQIQALGVENSYFPLFVSQDRLEKEKDHVEGFAPEVAWVTKSGEDDLAKHIAIRPTSETIMYPAFSDWISSHRDLPLKLNQWSNVVRWEFKDPTPFLRSREFLWQEGHTVHSTYEEAMAMVMQALDLYRRVYEELLAVPVVPGYKTEKEKFAGGDTTTTVEAYVPGSGRAIQGATSHNLGQNFGKMFDITFQDEKGNTQVAWQTSWGLTTRTIGVMVMVHGDDKGLVMPPRVAPLQAVIVPILSKKLELNEATPYCEAILKDLQSADIRSKYDDRTMYNPGWKYNHWEQKGVPIRVEVGPRDIEQKQARVVIRYNGEKIDMAVDGLGSALKTKLEEIQSSMFAKAKVVRDQHLVQVTEWKDFVPNLEKNNLVLTPWCGGEHTDWEDWVKEKSREESLKGEVEDERTATSVAAKTLCIPFEQPPIPPGTKCIASDIEATCWILWGRSY